MMSLLRKPEIIRPKVTTEFIWRTGDQIRPLWRRNCIGTLFEGWTGLGLRIWPFGQYVPVLRCHNLITNTGHQAANGKLSAQGGFLTFTTIAVGVGTTAATISNTALGTESTTGGAARHAATATQVTTTVTNDTTQLVLTITVTATLAISEEGIFDTTGAPTANIGNLLAQQVFATIALISRLSVRTLLNKLRELLGSLNPMGMVISSEAFA
jgi:hypothetical protein